MSVNRRQFGAFSERRYFSARGAVTGVIHLRRQRRWKCASGGRGTGFGRRAGEGAHQAQKAGGRKKAGPFALGAAKGPATIFGSGLLSHMTLCSIIGEEELNYRVRNGIGCTLFSMAAKKFSILIDREGRSFSSKTRLTGY